MDNLRSILVPITDSPASMAAVGVACAVARPRKSRVYVVHVIEVLRSLPLDAEMEGEARRGEHLLRRADAAAGDADYHVTGGLLQAREAGQAIVDEARARSVDAIIMGIGYKRLIGAFELGRTVDYVLKHATSGVWVVRQAVGEGHPAEAGR